MSLLLNDALLNGKVGEVREAGGLYEITFTRRLARPAEKVWAALTVPERLADWLAEAEVDLRVGGRFALYWATHDYRMAGVITELDPPRVFAWTWPSPEHPDSVVRWSLEPEEGGCRLTLRQTGLSAPPLRSVAAGWHTHLEGLQGAADGARTPWRAERERELAGLYAGLPA
ncbi:SRPBCC family protein [Phenylobacterium sp.]|uniref:SRPBCC family protein n=1 Tax=Phenylobacterium sp. TaxID=1871053 RepID=UPI00120ACECD|nr:SRPBCC family protein [Phenylobacterium sp.]THD62409.1 MAG: SRPBCC family protein [Phenylobacterium sp.]